MSGESTCVRLCDVSVDGTCVRLCDVSVDGTCGCLLYTSDAADE